MLASVEYQFINELAPGERLLWSGRPRRGIRLQPADAGRAIFGVVWCGGILLGFGNSLLNDPGPSALIFIPFLIFGLIVFAGQFVIEARRRAKTFYALTDRRVIIVSGIIERTVQSLPLQTLPEIALAERGNGSGTITFGNVSFSGIDDARRIFDLTRDAQSDILGIPHWRIKVAR